MGAPHRTRGRPPRGPVPAPVPSSNALRASFPRASGAYQEYVWSPGYPAHQVAITFHRLGTSFDPVPRSLDDDLMGGVGQLLAGPMLMLKTPDGRHDREAL